MKLYTHTNNLNILSKNIMLIIPGKNNMYILYL